VSVKLGDLTTDGVRALLDGGALTCVLLPVGSVEPHGPHLPLATDTIIGERAADLAAARLAAGGVRAVVAPAVGYGVTDFAAGFAGAISLPAAALTPFLRAVVEAYLDAGFAHVCLVNNHLEPAHDAAVRAAVTGLAPGRASVACPLSRRWGRTLSAEFKSGACHAGRYETSLVLAARPDAVDQATARALPPLSASLSDGIKAGLTRFADLGMARAYTGAPAEATIEEGAELYERLAEMIATETLEAMALLEKAR
jgi:creatinine amidohydrolase